MVWYGDRVPARAEELPGRQERGALEEDGRKEIWYGRGFGFFMLCFANFIKRFI